MKMDKLHKMLSKKKPLSGDMEKNAKMDVIQHLKDMASGQMKDRMGAMKKVSVASDSDQGLKAGLDKAHDIVDQHGQSDDSSMDQDSMMGMADGGKVDKLENQMSEAMDEVEHIEDGKNDDIPQITHEDEGQMDHMFNEDGESDEDRLESEEHTDPMSMDSEDESPEEDEMSEDEVDDHLKKLMDKKAKFKKA